ncbi:hypothetical protein HPP92_014782 [Vanilla planifolia]|uniref:RING-type E3 ubiquitin transferase n=1 Tax=Vanilla planifolia TaxID=51239 RepID=A0A835QGN2_VANPL|nr:hypothetical protein HPP92_014782 [Vanilla planifolia]
MLRVDPNLDARGAGNYSNKNELRQTSGSLPAGHVFDGRSNSPKVKEELSTFDAPTTPFTEDEDVCPTCLEEYDAENPRIITKMQTSFHLSCILEWLERSNTCAICDKVSQLVFVVGAGFVALVTLCSPNDINSSKEASFVFLCPRFSPSQNHHWLEISPEMLFSVGSSLFPSSVCSSLFPKPEPFYSQRSFLLVVYEPFRPNIDYAASAAHTKTEDKLGLALPKVGQHLESLVPGTMGKILNFGQSTRSSRRMETSVSVAMAFT